jgi:hypothetical protein
VSSRWDDPTVAEIVPRELQQVGRHLGRLFSTSQNRLAYMAPEGCLGACNPLEKVIAAKPLIWLPLPGLWAGKSVAITALGVLAAMRVRISDAVLMGDLTDFLKAAECRVRKVGEATLDVAMPRAPSAEQAQREIDIYLKTWQAMHPGSYARIVSEGRADSPT